jgi:pyruvate dehydrogenase E1 component alpha subunit
LAIYITYPLKQKSALIKEVLYMNLEKFNPLKDKMYQVLDEEGKVSDINELPELGYEQLIDIYKTMLFSRTIDEKALSYQRQGRMLTYAPNIGQEAAQIASAYALEKEDWLVPAFRELGAWLVRGVSLKNIYTYWYGDEWGSHTPQDVKVLPISVPIASQLQHATGIGMANNIKGENNVVMTYVGDGGTSHGDFHEALNFASVFKAPVVFIIQNNQYAISTKRSIQTMSPTLAQKAIAYGMPGVLVDGNDVFAMYNAAMAAVERARNGDGPTLIEAYTYRLAAHTTSDDPTKYRDETEVSQWKLKDPILRLGLFLKERGLVDDAWEKDTLAKLEKEVVSTFEEIESGPDIEIEDIFKFQYEKMPAQLEEQLEEYKSYLQGGN